MRGKLLALAGAGVATGAGYLGGRLAFGEGGGAALAQSEGLPLLGCIPLEPAVSQGGDTGAPIVLTEGEASSALRAITNRLVTELAPPISMSGCSARMLDAALAALDATDS